MSLSKHVFNHCNTFFATPDFMEIYTYVQGFVRKKSRTPHSLLEHTGRRGYYRLNITNNAEARQIVSNLRDTDHSDNPSDSSSTTADDDTQLDLFAHQPV